jgi:hypothetical protein
MHDGAPAVLLRMGRRYSAVLSGSLLPAFFFLTILAFFLCISIGHILCNNISLFSPFSCDSRGCGGNGRRSGRPRINSSTFPLLRTFPLAPSRGQTTARGPVGISPTFISTACIYVHTRVRCGVCATPGFGIRGGACDLCFATCCSVRDIRRL